MIKEEYIRNARVIKIVDGDTLDAWVDWGDSHWSKERLRLVRIDTPEVRGWDKARGAVAKEFVKSLLPVDTEIVIQTFKDPDDVFGRWLAEVCYMDGDIQYNLTDVLTSRGMVKH